MFNTLDGPFLNRIQELGNVVYKNLDELQLLLKSHLATCTLTLKSVVQKLRRISRPFGNHTTPTRR